MKKLQLLLLQFIFVGLVSAQWTTSGTNIYNSNTGNVGIGTTTPSAKLQVSGNALLFTGSNQMYFNELAAFDATKAGLRCNAGDLVVNAKNGGTLYINRDISADTRIQSFSGGTTIDIATFKSNGNVGIGTANPGSFKLAVEGTIGARAVKVTLTTPWPDYVFNKNYKGMTLSELENFIKINNHLPGIPSEGEIKKDGLDVGQMNAKLLEKIEELTLYIIELKKENDQIKNDLRKLSDKH